ncbi:SulP family inorganic anion transporter [Larsenimonas rhizosphaerae]|uniref:SulP family inorganic anion transporter n=1 Tax=Larsenimonas rhizosphaerae TaxID=2944682 RepID=A0AA42CU47_9GAMM|nr:SulP family inorganic anion transporter [Larsenimonas rhizosphaerae]MCX2523939.1 SulP family inorganic anion transporter [Larsenimonas rhizosphaerae]
MSFPFTLKYSAQDFPAGLVVFLVAIPLCLGIAIASGAPPVSGLIAGIVGGLVVASLSGSALSVSGPAAGLTVIVLGAINALGFEKMMMATVLAGVMQLVFGYLKLGKIGSYVPASVIKGMLAAIGLILILNQLPTAFGIPDGALPESLSPAAWVQAISPLAMVITLVSLGILWLWDSPAGQRLGYLRRIPAALMAVVVAIGIDRLSVLVQAPSVLNSEQYVQLPGLDGPAAFLGQLQGPALSGLLDPAVYMTALTIALIASLETLLSLEAVDKIDPYKRHSPPHRELKAQGVGNLVCGMIGGLPLTAVIVRSSANVQAGGRTRLAGFIHGALLLVSVMFFAFMLEWIPLACLAAILLHTGFKLARPGMMVSLYRSGLKRFAPFATTVVVIMMTDLLKGVAVGVLCGLFFMLRSNHRSVMSFNKSGHHCLLRIHKDISFLSRERLRQYLDLVPENSYLIIDAGSAGYIDPDIFEDIDNFMASSRERNITVELKAFNGVTATFAPVAEKPLKAA